MPAGVEVSVDADGFATVVFRDQSLRGPGVARLLAVGGAATVEKLTLPEPAYRVPEGNAREAGLLDETPPADVPADSPDVPVARPRRAKKPPAG